MDHLPWSTRSGKPRLQVPYLVAEDSDLENFDSSRILREIQDFRTDSSQSLAHVALKAQTWLYFGLLKLVLGNSYRTTHFVEHGTVHTKRLEDLVTLRLKEHKPIASRDGEPSYTAFGTKVAECLRQVVSKFSSDVVPQLLELENYTENENLTLWNSPAYRVLFSLPILFSLLRALLYLEGQVPPEALPSVEDHTLITDTAVVARTLAASGRCPSLVKRLPFLEEELYTLVSFPPQIQQHRHGQCSRTRCVMSNIDEADYRTRHIDSCVESNCHPLGFDCESLYKVIDAGHIPLVSSRLDTTGRVTIELQAGTFQSQYTAISHVWAGGLGNTEGNYLPSCQVAQLHRQLEAQPNHTSLVSFSSGNLASYASVLSRIQSLSQGNTKQLFYIDTLCVPRSPARPTEYAARASNPARIRSNDLDLSVDKATSYRRKAIDAMSRIYAGASNVLVLDVEIQSEDSQQLTDVEIELAIASSPWTSRCWTLHEGALSLKVLFQFASVARTYPNPGLASQVRRPSIPLDLETAWADLVQSEEHPERPPTVLRYIESMFLSNLLNPPQTRSWSLEAWDLNQFARIWNALMRRDTSKPNDVAAILASLLNLSAGEILRLDPPERIQALLKHHKILPATILLVPKTWHSTSLDWLPNLPIMGSSAPLMTYNDGVVVEVTESGLVFDDILNKPDSMWYVAPTWTESEAIQHLRLPDAGFLKIEIASETLSQPSYADYDAAPRILWLTKNRDADGHFLGCWFKGRRVEEATLHVTMGAVLRWTFQQDSETAPKDQPQPKCFDCFVSLDSVLGSGHKRMIVEMGECFNMVHA